MSSIYRLEGRRRSRLVLRWRDRCRARLKAARPRQAMYRAHGLLSILAPRPRNAYNLQMSFQGEIETKCAVCKESFEAPVWSFVSGADEAQRNQIKAGECNLLLCPHCGAAFMPDASWIYFEPEAEILAFVFPESWHAEEAKWREKMKTDFAAMREALGDRLPLTQEPLVFFGQEGLGELLQHVDWKIDERDVMEFHAKELGLSVYRASPAWARAHNAPTEFPYVGKPTRESLIAGMEALLATNDRLTTWGDFLAAFRNDASAALPPPALKR